MINFIRFLINIFDFFTQKKIFDVIHKELESKLPVFVDVGSHMGEYIIQLLKRFNVEKIYAFEPSPTIFKKLSKNVRKVRNVGNNRNVRNDRNVTNFRMIFKATITILAIRLIWHALKENGLFL